MPKIRLFTKTYIVLATCFIFVEGINVGVGLVYRDYGYAILSGALALIWFVALGTLVAMGIVQRDTYWLGEQMNLLERVKEFK